jgi:hypothetical protein
MSRRPRRNHTPDQCPPIPAWRIRWPSDRHGPTPMDDLGLEQADHRFGERCPSRALRRRGASTRSSTSGVAETLDAEGLVHKGGGP